MILTVNEVFPCCRRCGDKVRYKLLQAAPHICEDPDFNETVSVGGGIPPKPLAQKHALPLQLGWDHGFRFWQDPVQAGERVQKPGIYRVVHHRHRSPHDATLRAGEIFPTCRKFGANVRFELFVSADGEAPDEKAGGPA